MDNNETQTVPQDFLFDEVKHEYTMCGKKMLSVSELISIYGNDIDESMETIFEVAAERGTTLHKMLEMLLSGESIQDEYPSEYEPYIEGIQSFVNDNKITPIVIEKPIYSLEMWIAGTPDMLCLFGEDEKVALVDYKFVSQVSKTKVKAQLNAYRRIYAENGVEVDRLITIQFLNTGTYRLYNTAIDDTEVDVALKVQELKNKTHNKGMIN